MQLHKLLAFNTMILLVIFTSSCTRSDNFQDTPHSESTLVQSPMSTSYTLPSAVTKTMSHITMTPAYTIIPTNTTTKSPTSTITPIIVPTLSMENAKLQLIDYLSNNGNCTLPCFWGITPGKSTFLDAQIILEPLSSISDLTHFGSERGTIYLRYSDSYLIISTNISFLTYPNNEIINRINFEARALEETTGEGGEVGVFNSSVFGERLSLYMLPQILSQYGRPSSIMLTTLAEPPPQSRGGDIGYFRIVLLYPDKGIFVRYITKINLLNEIVLGCPNNAHVELELYPAGNGDSFFENLDPSLQEDIRNNYKPLEEVTSMSIGDFYQTFHEPTDTCIKTPSNLWPSPEQ